MYHSWDSQNAWLRQIAAQNYIYINRATAATLGIKDDDWVWLISHIGKIGAQARQMDGVDANTVWTWNALGKAVGAWGLDETANESVEGFIMNHLISEWLPPSAKDETTAVENSDPITDKRRGMTCVSPYGRLLPPRQKSGKNKLRRRPC